MTVEKTQPAEATEAATVSAVHPVPISDLYLSPTVSMLVEKERPQGECVCSHCVAAIWFTVPGELKCYCQRMKAIVWQSHKPLPITRCDTFSDHIPEKE